MQNAFRNLNEGINELIHTEKKYIERLQLVVDKHIPQLEKTAQANLPSPNFTKENIFSNIEEILYFHKKVILPGFERHKMDLKQLANVFIDNVS